MPEPTPDVLTDTPEPVEAVGPPTPPPPTEWDLLYAIYVEAATTRMYARWMFISIICAVAVGTVLGDYALAAWYLLTR